MKLVSVVGTRPQLIKAAALQPALRARHEEVFVDTGQHWDEAMAGAFFRELGLARPDHELAAGGGSHTEQTAAMLLGLESVLANARPDAVLVYGDTNSTLAGALAAAQRGIPVAHVEAGLRSFDRSMPEEVNRVVADHLARWLFAPNAEAAANLAAEGITDGVAIVGDVLHDLLAAAAPAIAAESALAAAGAALTPGGYCYATVHRQANREPDAVRAWAAILDDAAGPDRPVVLSLHPGTRAALAAANVHLRPDVRVVGPLGYHDSLALQLHAAAVLTDSGGVQRESMWFGTPCLILRATTEWGEALSASDGEAVLVGLDRERAAAALARLAPAAGARDRARARAAGLAVRPSGAAGRIVDALGS